MSIFEAASASVLQVSPRDERAVEVIRDHLHDLEPTAPVDSQHALTPERMLQVEGFRLFAAVANDSVLAIGGLAPVAPGHEEIKSMYTVPSMRGRGMARLVLDALIADAKERGVNRLSLETGRSDFFMSAHRLYLASGFVCTDAFGSYSADDHNSLFMTRAL